ncbi:hypothetical protein B0H19DRAFT_1256263 [Mycena capillaripes]|nr:hypothetical protein B0H19DRAFT_1256263 [Mycena capillaripes]
MNFSLVQEAKVTRLKALGDKAAAPIKGGAGPQYQGLIATTYHLTDTPSDTSGNAFPPFRRVQIPSAISDNAYPLPSLFLITPTPAHLHSTNGVATDTPLNSEIPSPSRHPSAISPRAHTHHHAAQHIPAPSPGSANTRSASTPTFPLLHTPAPAYATRLFVHVCLDTPSRINASHRAVHILTSAMATLMTLQAMLPFALILL